VSRTGGRHGRAGPAGGTGAARPRRTYVAASDPPPRTTRSKRSTRSAGLGRALDLRRVPGHGPAGRVRDPGRRDVAAARAARTAAPAGRPGPAQPADPAGGP